MKENIKLKPDLDTNRRIILFGVLCLLISFPVTVQGKEAVQPSEDEYSVESGVSHVVESVPISIKRVEYEHQLLGYVENRSLTEASGLALSTRYKNVAWAHNDSGSGAYLYAFNLLGESRGRFYLDGTRSRDWEDMDAFRWRDQSWLLVADTGDNRSKKPYYDLYLAAEPELPEVQVSRSRPIRDVQRAKFVFPTGPADTEAVAVDESEERVYLITKRRRPALVFSLPLSIFSESDKVHSARFETKLFTLPSPTLQDIVEHPNLGLAFAQPNAMDFSPDRSFAIVHTYGHSYLFRRSEGQSWAQAFAAPPEQIDVPSMKQSEAVAVGPDSRSLYYTSEGKAPPLYRLFPKSVDTLKKRNVPSEK